ncbi:hypothetical protein [Bounagaea algeriensis]
MTDEQPPDVEFTSTVSAHELRFREVPESRVTFTGNPDHESSSGSDRTNLPDAVSPRVTYRDIRVDYHIVSRLRADNARGWQQRS